VGRVDWGQAQAGRFGGLKPSMAAMSLRLPVGLLERIKIEAERRGVPYQALIRMWLAEKVG
jgi:predicted DNA binding CopG/RHH family protein